MKGKEKCKALKEIRKQIADENDIPYAVSQCTHKGDCKGTCPKCEAELKYLEKELAIRQGLGKAVAIVGLSMGICSSLTACSPIQPLANFIDSITEDELEGEAVPTEGVLPTPEDDLSEGDLPYDPSDTLPDVEEP